MASRDEYKLLHIKDALSCINQRVNLVGAVFEFGVPRQSKGTDCFCTLKLIDESYQSPGFTVNVFAESMEKLPQVRSSGDIIQFCQVVVFTENSFPTGCSAILSLVRTFAKRKVHPRPVSVLIRIRWMSCHMLDLDQISGGFSTDSARFYNLLYCLRYINTKSGGNVIVKSSKGYVNPLKALLSRHKFVYLYILVWIPWYCSITADIVSYLVLITKGISKLVAWPFQIKAHHGEVYALFNKKFSSFALFEGKPNEDFTPYQVSLKFHMRGLGKDFITCLRTWLLGFRFDTGTRETMLLLREIHEGLRFDLVCKILHICELSKGEWMLFVWDGTDTPPLCFETKLEDEAKSPLPLQLEPSLLPRDILSAFPCVGTVLRVTVDQENEKLGLHLLDSGRWVKFINIICQACSGLWHGVLMPFTKIRLLANEDTIVKHREEFYKERVSSKLESMPLSCFPGPSHITETDYDDVRFATLMEVLTYSQVTAKFKCIVRIVATYPWQIEDFRSLGIYRMRWTLEDPTARIHAYVYAEDGEKFFEGHPPVDVLKQKRNKLLGISEWDDGTEDEKAPRNPPWVQCCIKSYYIDKSDAWGSRRYRIFATRMVG